MARIPEVVDIIEVRETRWTGKATCCNQEERRGEGNVRQSGGEEMKKGPLVSPVVFFVVFISPPSPPPRFPFHNGATITCLRHRIAPYWSFAFLSAVVCRSWCLDGIHDVLSRCWSLVLQSLSCFQSPLIGLCSLTSTPERIINDYNFTFLCLELIHLGYYTKCDTFCCLIFSKCSYSTRRHLCKGEWETSASAAVLRAGADDDEPAHGRRGREGDVAWSCARLPGAALQT